MDGYLHVLLIEDSSDDALLLRDTLEAGGFRVEPYRVETRAGLENALEASDWDLVVSDYNLPGFDGLTALSVVKNFDADLPFIMVSGAVGEGFVVEAMRAGAQDFIAKDGLIRLVPAVRRELEETEIRRARRRVETALRESETRFRMLADNMSQFAWMALDNSEVIWVNSRWHEYTGLGVEDLASVGWFRAVHPEHLGRIESSFQECRRTGTPWDEVFPLRGRDGGFRWFLCRAVPIRSGDDRVTRWFGTFTDITEIRETQEALRRAKEEAEAANVAKSEFLAHMSHELRTPISGILGMVDVLSTRTCDDDQRNYLSMVRESAQSLLSIIGDILDLSRIEAGIVEMKSVECSVREEMELLIAPFRFQAQKSGLELTLSVDERVPARVKADMDKIFQVLRNLVSNAVKYTERGTISVSVTLDPSGEGRLLFSVEDTGIGIPREKQESVFESFVRLRKSVTERNVEGTGLGLTISRRLVEYLGGTLTVKSAPGHGSTFTFTAAFEPPAVTPSGKPPNASKGLHGLRPLSILLAEDNRINRMFIEITLRDAGHRVTVAENGREACDAVFHGGRYDIVLMDIQMPVMDGIDAAKCIREIDGDAGRVPIIALTAFAMKGDEEKFREAGMSGHVTKPIDWDDLSKVIRSVIPSEAA